MAVDLETRPLDVTDALSELAETPSQPPTASHRWPVVIGAAALALLLAVAAAVATWPAPSRSRPASSPVSPTAPAGSVSGTPQGSAPSSAPLSAPSSAVAGTRAGSSSGAVAATAQSPATSTPWSKRDPAVLSAGEAAYFIAGTIYGDPPGNRPGVVTISSSAATHLRRGGKSGATLDQLRQAVQALGGQSSVARSKSGGGRAAFTLPAGHSIVLDSHGSVRVNGVDAFGLQRTASGWTSTATGPQVRAFLAGFIEGEGSVGGKIGDDPTSAHLAFVQALMSTSQAYGVHTVLTGTRYFGLWMASSADNAKVQAYPFITFIRCPGGQP